MNNRRKSPRLNAKSSLITSYKSSPTLKIDDDVNTPSSSSKKSSTSYFLIKSSKKRINKYSKLGKISTRSSNRLLEKNSIIHKADTSCLASVNKSRKRKVLDDNSSSMKRCKYQPKTRNSFRDRRKNNKKNKKCFRKATNFTNKNDNKMNSSSAINNKTNSLLLPTTSSNANNNNNNTTNETDNVSLENSSINDTDSALNNTINNNSSLEELKQQLKKATIKFDKACKQLINLDQHMNDLQNSYSNSLENDRKTFKILYRMQLATLEGTHNAYIEYIERQVEKIKKIKCLLFNDSNISTDNNNNN